jgi:hypothetical protein
MSFPSIGGGYAPAVPYVSQAASPALSFSAPAPFMHNEGVMGAGAVCGIVFAVLAIIAVAVILGVMLKGGKSCPPAQLNADKLSKTKPDMVQHRLASDHQPVPAQYQSGQTIDVKMSQEQTLKQLREEHALVGTCADPTTQMQYLGGHKNKDKPNGEWLFEHLESNHPHKQTVQRAQERGGPPQAPPMPMPESLYTQAGIGKAMGKCKKGSTPPAASKFSYSTKYRGPLSSK